MTVNRDPVGYPEPMTKRCEHCGKDMAHKRATARTCSAACRKALSRRAGKPDAEHAPKPPGWDAEPVHPPRKDDADPLGTPPAEPRGRLEASVRAKFDTMGHDYEADPLAVHILGMAHALDTPGSMAPGSLTGMGKAFRDAYKEYLREHEAPDTAEDPVAAAQAAAAEKLRLLQGGAA